jgi:hypothetical protein
MSSQSTAIHSPGAVDLSPLGAPIKSLQRAAESLAVPRRDLKLRWELPGSDHFFENVSEPVGVMFA